MGNNLLVAKVGESRQKAVNRAAVCGCLEPINGKRWLNGCKLSGGAAGFWLVHCGLWRQLMPLLHEADKNVIGARRASWRIVSSIKQEEESRGNQDYVSVIKEYRSKIEAELTEICGGILKLLDQKLVPAAAAADSKAMKAASEATITLNQTFYQTLTPAKIQLLRARQKKKTPIASIVSTSLQMRT
ncbi:hypothetical protein WN943_003678 [Citrus x changshan-huyou]